MVSKKSKKNNKEGVGMKSTKRVSKKVINYEANKRNVKEGGKYGANKRSAKDDEWYLNKNYTIYYIFVNGRNKKNYFFH